MSAQTPNIQETLDNGVIGQLADVVRLLKGGQMTAAAINGLMQQVFTADITTSAQAYSWAELGIGRPRDADNAAGEYGVSTTLIDATGTITTVKAATGLTLSATGAGRIAGTVVGSPYVEHQAVSSNAATLLSSSTAPVPRAILDVVGLNAGATDGPGRLELIIDPDSSRTPASGQVIWDGTTGLRFSSADTISDVRVILIPDSAGLEASLLNRLLGQRD